MVIVLIALIERSVKKMKMITINEMEDVINRVLIRFDGFDNIRLVKNEFDREMKNIKKRKIF